MSEGQIPTDLFIGFIKVPPFQADPRFLRTEFLTMLMKVANYLLGTVNQDHD